MTNDNEIGLKEGGGIEMSIYSAFHIRDARSLSLVVFYLPNRGAQYVKPSNEFGQINHTLASVCNSRRYCWLPSFVLSCILLISKTSDICICPEGDVLALLAFNREGL